jgi:hypothetical protein
VGYIAILLVSFPPLGHKIALKKVTKTTLTRWQLQGRAEFLLS